MMFGKNKKRIIALENEVDKFKKEAAKKKRTSDAYRRKSNALHREAESANAGLHTENAKIKKENSELLEEIRDLIRSEAVIADEVMDALECKYIGGLTGMKVGDVVGVCSVPYELILVHDDYGYGRKAAPKEAPEGEGE